MTAARSTATVAVAVSMMAAGAVGLAGGAAAAPGQPGQPRYTPGAEGAGDEYFPFSGNGGYDVRHYDLEITYTPPDPAPAPLEGQLEGVATIDLVALQDLDRLNLDLRGLEVSAVTVNGKPVKPVEPPEPGGNVGGPAYWHTQDDAEIGRASCRERG